MADLTFLDDQFEEAEEPQGGTSVPDGQYTAKVENVEFTETRTAEPKPILKQELVITDGEFSGKSLYRNNLMSTAQNLGYLKKDLRALGIDVNAPGFKLSHFLQNGLSELLDKVVGVTVKNKLDQTGTMRCNVYINDAGAGAGGNGHDRPTVGAAAKGDPSDPWASDE
jgi:hypothetical protein